MILTLILLGLVFLGIFLMIVGPKISRYYDDDICLIGMTLSIFFGIILLICLCLISIEHLDAYESKAIELDRMEYEALMQEKELAMNSEYDDIGRITVTKDIVEWNKKVYTSKRAIDHKWINWFHSKRIVDELHYIDMSFD